MCLDITKQECKVFIGGLSWETTGDRLRSYFENFGTVREAFVSYNRSNGKPRGFGFVVFESSDVADKVVAAKHTLDRREVEAKRAVPKDENAAAATDATGIAKSAAPSHKSRKLFVGGLAPAVDDAVLRQYFEGFGMVEEAVVMYDHDNKKPRGFGFVSFAQEESVDKVFGAGAIQCILEKQIEIKPAVPRDQMLPAPHQQASMMLQYRGMLNTGPYGAPAHPYSYGHHAAHSSGRGQFNSFGPPEYPPPHATYMQAPPPAVSSMGRPSPHAQPRPPPRQQYSGPHQQYDGSPVGSLSSANSVPRHQPQPASTPLSSNTSSFTAGGTAGHAAALQAVQQQEVAVAAAGAVNGYNDLYALSNCGGSDLFHNDTQTAALYGIANGAFQHHLNSVQTTAAGINGSISSLGQQGLQNLKALAANYSSYGGGTQHSADSYVKADDLTYAGTDADVFAKQISTRMAGLAVSGGEYGLPYTSANTIGSGWSH